MVTTLAIPPATDRANLIELPEPPAVAPLKNEPLPSVIARGPVRPPLLKPAMTPPAPQPTESAKAPILRTPAPKTESLPIESAKAARRTTAGNSSLIRTLGLKLGRVVIDPGHGGHDQGTESARGLLEKDLVLDVAKRVGKLIEDRLGAEVIYTRSDDTFIPLEARTALANDNKADLFLSIHANSSPAVHIAGVETYFRSFTTARDALDVAARENATSQKSIAELEDVIHTMMLGEKVEESKEFAARVQASLFAFSARNFPGIRDRGVKKAPFVVLAGAKAPSVLVEIGFLSNAKEESLLHKGDYRQKLAEALFRGVSRYAEGLSHFAVAKARPD
jgi:N-acetylmuramoyl-L-alanine amidase